MQGIFHRLWCGFMALYLLNCCVDAPDASGRWKSENLSYNEQESVIELVVEKALGYGDVIPEYDDTDSGNESPVKKNISIDFFLLPQCDLIQNERIASRVAFNPNHNNLNPREIPDYISPPPEI
ncbi:hypothetical protein [Flavobacterium selenitireducens]|uniref:hypothetical protein n=1 Tax=Flavobacterium selenitireducens TaxID=2722704 RepID=UPI00168AE80E|nr:hypothetical protein [Flavobacterium selenitireducens]MBD3583946.1 hypothetical protein [Flavobacterium selenitireducens]